MTTHTTAEAHETLRMVLDGKIAGRISEWPQLTTAINTIVCAYDASLKQGAVVEPVAWAIGVHGGITDVFLNKDKAQIEFDRREREYPRSNRFLAPLYTTPPAPHATTDTTDAAQGGIWRCQQCGDLLAATDPSWRWAGEAWQHWHAHVGHVDARQFPQPIPAEQQAASEGRRVTEEAAGQSVAPTAGRDWFPCPACGANLLVECVACSHSTFPVEMTVENAEHEAVYPAMHAAITYFASTLPAGDEGMRRTLERARGAIIALAGRKPVRDLDETLAEIQDALNGVAAQTAGGGK